jgi:hypothetical protein
MLDMRQVTPKWTGISRDSEIFLASLIENPDGEAQDTESTMQIAQSSDVVGVNITLNP